ncbi:MAG: hypothetical protein KJ018_16180 [Burkholderiales bacterium]|nr:hypothetical protein [Burkholderiales bacterium]
MTRWIATVACLVALAAGVAHGTVVVNDGDFSSWTFGSHGTSATASREASGGNPGARLTLTTSTPSGTAYGYGLKSDYVASVALAGTAFTLTVDVLLGSPGLQAVELLVEQGGTFYRRALGDTGTPATWTTRVFNGTFDAASFVKLDGPGPDQPDFSGATATRFGLAAGNSFSQPITAYYDNVRLDFAAVAPTDPCAGFSDVAADESFCQATIWLKNRGVTSGCSATQYCPTLTVTRAQMALFMNRLGRALAPEALHNQAQLQNFVLPNENTPPGLLACATGDFATGGFARSARFTATYHAYPAQLPVVSRGYWRYSTDGGTTWGHVGNWMVDQFPSSATANPGSIASATVLAPPLALAPDKTYRFGLFLDGGVNDGIHGTLLLCQIQVDIVTPP